jgi:hypothetical protein
LTEEVGRTAVVAFPSAFETGRLPIILWESLALENREEMKEQNGSEKYTTNDNKIMENTETTQASTRKRQLLLPEMWQNQWASSLRYEPIRRKVF